MSSGDSHNNGEVEQTLLDLPEVGKAVQKHKVPDPILQIYTAGDSNRAAALSTLMNGKVPEYAIRKHPGTGGKMFKYVDHVWVTQLLRDAFGPYWGSEVLNAVIESDGTATATVKLTIKIPTFVDRNNPIHEIVFTELGACNITTGMTIANRKLSAASKGLVRCAFRAFGLGQEFYNTVSFEDLTNEESWRQIQIHIKKNKKYITEDDVVKFCKENNISNTQISERFEDIWNFIGLTVASQKIKEK